MRSAADQAVGDAGTEDAEAEERERGQHQRHGVLERRLLAAKSAGELAEQGRADADDDGERQHLDAGRDHIAEHAFGEERGLVEQAEGNEHEARERRQLELDQGDEQLDRQNEEGDENDEPGDHQHGDLDEVLEERRKAEELACRLQDRLAGVDPDLSDAAGLQELIGRKTGACGLETKAREGVEDDLCEGVEVADQEGEEPDIKGLLDQADEHVVFGPESPEQARERNVDHDQGRGKEGDFAAEQAEA